MYFLRIIKNNLVSYIEKDKKENPRKSLKIKTPEKKVSVAKSIKINTKQNLIGTY
jgi:hypothetical protein